MSMVRNGYQPVYRPKAYSFSGVTESEAGLTDTLTIEDAEGQAWTAVYTLEKQPDGSGRSRAVISRRPVFRREIN